MAFLYLEKKLNLDKNLEHWMRIEPTEVRLQGDLVKHWYAPDASKVSVN